MRSGIWVENAKLLARLESCQEMPTPGPAAAKLIELVGHDTIEPGSLAEALELHPPLARRAVALANHPLRSSRRRARNLRQMIGQLGSAGTAHLALALVLEQELSPAAGICLDREIYWRCARERALTAWVLGTAARLPVPEEAFLGGLLQDVGMLALDLVLPQFYPDLGAKELLSPTELEALEGSLVSVPHNLVGAWLAKRWGLPECLQRAIACSHEASAAPAEDSALAACVQLSELLAALAAEPADIERSRRLAAEAKRCLHLDPAEVARMYRLAATALAEAPAAFAEPGDSAAALSKVVPIGAAVSVSPPPPDWRNALTSFRSLPDPVTTAISLEAEFGASLEHGWPVSVVLLQTTGTGTPTAHRSLDQAVRTLSRTLRPSDLMGRLDDETLLITMPGTGRDEAAAAGRRLTQILHQVGVEGLGTATSASDAPSDSWQALLALAERALSAARLVGSRICSAG
jgi:HD-like signal output (HDOD) protein